MVAPVPCALAIATSVSKQTNTCARRFAITISSVLYLTSLTGALHKNKRKQKFSIVFAVGLTTAAVALVVRTLLPGMPWAPAIALGAVVAPPDAAAATAVLRPLRPPHGILTILEGESLLNDASALLIYRLAIGAVAANGFSIRTVAPAFMLAVAGSLVAGSALGWLVLRLMGR